MSREMDAEVARMLGWTRLHQYNDRNPTGWPDEKTGRRVVPYYTSDPAADYSVLQHVREKWAGQQEAFANILHGTWERRWDEKYQGESLCTGAWWLMYVVGDYARAALASLAAMKESAQ